MAYGLTQSADLESSSSQYFSRADNAAIRVLNGWTVETWVKLETLQNQSLCRSRSGENGWGIFLNADGTIRPEAGSGAFDGANGTTALTTGVWYFIRVYFNGASTKIYINGTLDATVSIPNITNPSATVYIGSSNGASGFYDGRLSLFRIWNNEHTANDGCTFYGTATSNMQAEWSLDNTLADSSGNGLTLTNHNSVNFGADLPAVCLTALPTVSTDPATAVTATSATGNGEVTDDGGATIDRRGFVFGTTSAADPGNVSPEDQTEYDYFVAESGTFGEGVFDLPLEIDGDTDEGPLYPGTVTNEANGTGSVSWVNPNNAKISDGTYTTANTGFLASLYLFCTNFGFSVPSDATVAGITVEFNGIKSGTVTDGEVKIVKGGAAGSINKGTNSTWPTGAGFLSYGGVSDLWGETWTPAQINSSDFGAAITAFGVTGGSVASIDSVRVTVYYTLSSDLTQNTTYYVRAFAQNTAGYSYGDQESFTTLGGFNPHIARRRLLIR